MNVAQRSAKIYQFPVRVRIVSSADGLETKSSIALPAVPAVEVMSGSGWYHEAAMRDAERTAKH